MNTLGHSVLSYQREHSPGFVFVHTPNTPYSIVSFWLRAGSRFDPPGKEGLAHLFEHLLTKRTKQFPNAITRLEHLEHKGILYGAFTSQEPVYFYTVQEPEQGPEAFNILLDSSQNAIIKPENIEAEKKTVLDEQQRAGKDPLTQVWNLANAGLWPASSLSRVPLGTQESIENIMEGDVDSFREKYYSENNLTVIVISPRAKEAEIFEDKIRKLKSSTKPKFKSEQFKKPAPIITKSTNEDFVQIAISFLLNDVNSQDKIATLHLIKNCLAGGWSSRLIQRLRLDKKLTYWVNGYTRYFSDTGVLRFTLSSKKENLKNVTRVVDEELGRLKDKEVEKRDLDTLKKMTRIGILTNSLSPKDLLWRYGWNTLVHPFNPLSLDDYLEKLNSINSKEIKNTANKYLTNPAWALIGNVPQTFRP